MSRRPTSGKVKYKSSSSKVQVTQPDSAVVSSVSDYFTEIEF